MKFRIKERDIIREEVKDASFYGNTIRSGLGGVLEASFKDGIFDPAGAKKLIEERFSNQLFLTQPTTEGFKVTETKTQVFKE